MKALFLNLNYFNNIMKIVAIQSIKIYCNRYETFSINKRKLLLRGRNSMEQKSLNYQKKDKYILFDIFLSEMNFENSMELSREIKAILHENSYPDTIIDLNTIAYIDSTSIGTFISIYNLLKSKNKKLLILCNKKSVLKIFQLLKVDRILTILATMEEAVAQIG